MNLFIYFKLTQHVSQLFLFYLSIDVPRNITPYIVRNSLPLQKPKFQETFNSKDLEKGTIGGYLTVLRALMVSRLQLGKHRDNQQSHLVNGTNFDGNTELCWPRHQGLLCYSWIHCGSRHFSSFCLT